MFFLFLCSAKYFLNMEKKEIIQTLDDIRDMMARSSRFQAISGVSIIIVGLYASLASLLVFLLFGVRPSICPELSNTLVLNTPYRIRVAVLAALALFILSFATVTLMAWRKAKRLNLPFAFDKRMFQMILNFFIPLVTGGLLCLALILQGHYGLTSSIMLIFYGLALISTQHYTYPAMRFLGYGELLLGLIDCFTVHYGFLFWFLGFGVLHILFGIVYTFRFGKKQNG